jgi:small-conductance mechanosensitive channel
VAGILGTVLAAIVILYFIQRNSMIEMETLLTEQKDSLTNELVMLKHGYDTLKTNNDTLNAKLDEERQKIERLLSINASNVQTIRTYRKEISTMREIMKSYIVQIDSLNTRNQLLIAENTEIKQQMRQVEQTNVALSKEKSELTSQVEIASVIKAREINPIPLNKKRKETDRLSRFEKLEVAFILNENPIVEAGKKTIYIRITRPDGLVITNSPDNLFEVEGERMIFTENRTVDYLNKDVEMSIFVDNNGDFIDGTYAVDLFLEGHSIGSSSFMLRSP